MFTIRKATPEDIPAITSIYNEAIETTVATFDTEPKTVEQQTDWYYGHGPKNPILVAEADGGVIGWACLKPYSDRKAYENTAELSLYISSASRGQGVGKQLMGQVLEHGKAAGLHTVLSRVTEGNESSLHLHRVFGFGMVGTMREVGVKFDRLLDVHMLQKIFD